MASFEAVCSAVYHSSHFGRKHATWRYTSPAGFFGWEWFTMGTSTKASMGCRKTRVTSQAPTKVNIFECSAANVAAFDSSRVPSPRVLQLLSDHTTRKLCLVPAQISVTMLSTTGNKSTRLGSGRFSSFQELSSSTTLQCPWLRA